MGVCAGEFALFSGGNTELILMVSEGCGIVCAIGRMGEFVTIFSDLELFIL